jgi:hypothetical protein
MSAAECCHILVLHPRFLYIYIMVIWNHLFGYIKFSVVMRCYGSDRCCTFTFSNEQTISNYMRIFDFHHFAFLFNDFSWFSLFLILFFRIYNLVHILSFNSYLLLLINLFCDCSYLHTYNLRRQVKLKTRPQYDFAVSLLLILNLHDCIFSIMYSLQITAIRNCS